MLFLMATDREITKELIRLRGYGSGEKNPEYQFAKNAPSCAVQGNLMAPP